MNTGNFCERILAAAQRHPDRLALRVPDLMAPPGQHEDITYGELAMAVARRQTELDGAGLKKGHRVLLFMAPGIPLYVTLIALLAMGMVPVLVERGMPRKTLRATLATCGAQAVIGDIRVLRLWWLFPPLWAMQRFTLSGSFPGIRNLNAFPPSSTHQVHCEPMQPDDHGLITYTSGSTGLPKGADRTHGSLIAQHLAIRAHWPDNDDDIDLPAFPVLVLHNLCCGISTLLPDTDLAFPGQARAERILRQIEQHQVTRVAGSPAYMARLTAHALGSRRLLNRVRSVVIGGSTLTWQLAERCRLVFPHADIRVVYGSTEAEPISDIGIDALLSDWSQHEGHLVGHPADATSVRIVRTGLPLDSEADVIAATVDTGQEGEILVSGTHVLRRYVDNPDATRESKIMRPDGTVWHRTGDTGIFDAAGRLWLTGRLKDRVTVNGVKTSPFALEKKVDAIAGITRSALMEDTSGPVLVIEGSHFNPDELVKVLERSPIQGLRLARIAQMPVDSRHNSKIDRPALRAMLGNGQLRTTGSPDRM